jgi:cation diffusion facilitator family transporter
MAARSRTDHPALKGIRPVITGAIANAVLALVKISAGIFGNSYALIADGIESATDILSSLILWLGLKVAAKAPDSDHPYGHGKAEPIAGALVALALFGAAVLIVVESIHNITTPHELPKRFTLYVLGAIIIVKEILYQYVNKVSKEIKSMAINGDAWHHRSDAISSAAAFVGIAIALFMGPGYESADAWAAIVASLVIALNAYKILNPAIAEMMDAAPSAELVKEVKEVAAKVPGVTGLDKCHIRKMGFDYYVDLHVEVNGSLSVFEGHEIAHHVKEAILDKIPHISDVLIHIEPDGGD